MYCSVGVLDAGNVTWLLMKPSELLGEGEVEKPAELSLENVAALVEGSCIAQPSLLSFSRTVFHIYKLTLKKIPASNL